MFLVGRRINVLKTDGTNTICVPMDGGHESENRPPLYIIHHQNREHFESLELVPDVAEDEEEDNDFPEMAPPAPDVIPEDIMENPVIAAEEDSAVDDDDEEDEDWVQNPYNVVDVSLTVSEGSDVDPEIFYSICDFDKQFEEELLSGNGPDTDGSPPQHDPSIEDNHNNNSYGS